MENMQMQPKLMLLMESRTVRLNVMFSVNRWACQRFINFKVLGSKIILQCCQPVLAV